MLDNAAYLVAALAATGVGIAGYLVYLGQRTRELRRDVAELHREDAGDRPA